MRLQQIEIAGFKSFAKKSMLAFTAPVTAVVGPNGSGKSNVVEAFRFVLGEQSMKSMRGKSGADLIFRGSNGASKLSRAAVSIAFDNSDKVFAFLGESEGSRSPILFDTITFTREIFADGTSRYLMNGTEIRLKQMVELLASVNIGTSSHHIISQGEADSILRASPRDRREMLEDALGLKIYHYRIKESESKLDKATETLKDVQSLRRELAPHLTFLKKQVEKIEKGRALRTELEDAMLRYLATERVLLQTEDARVREARALIQSRQSDIQDALAALPKESSNTEDTAARSRFQKQLADIREQRRSIESRIARLEGILEAHRTMMRAPVVQSETAITFAPSEYHQLLSDLEFFLESIRDAQTLDAAKDALASVDRLLAALKDREPKQSAGPERGGNDSQIRETALELEGLQADLKKLIVSETQASESLAIWEEEREAMLAQSRSATEQRYRLEGDSKQCDAELQILAISQSAFAERKERFDAELKEAGFLFGPSFLHALKDKEAIPELDLADLKRAIDRLKIRLDEHSGIGNEVLEEYESTKERDAFLQREVADIEGSIRNLQTLIVDLKKILDDKFTSGVTIINERFGDFFKTMFGGGSAFLSVTIEKKRRRKSDTDILNEEDVAEGGGPEPAEGEAFERGIDVHVNLPSKKVKELNMLSGGERSLVSIALLFAISQVNPPPFLVLDETDAALDEANSRKYGDMLERLAEYSQLIVVTHNRETMSRANVLYGVTLGSDGGSKLLSIKFDDAVKVAK